MMGGGWRVEGAASKAADASRLPNAPRLPTHGRQMDWQVPVQRVLLPVWCARFRRGFFAAGKPPVAPGRRRSPPQPARPPSPTGFCVNTTSYYCATPSCTLVASPNSPQCAASHAASHPVVRKYKLVATWGMAAPDGGGNRAAGW